jgi:O-antigen ligase
MAFRFFLALVFIRPFISDAYPGAGTLFIALLLTASLPLLSSRRAEMRKYARLSVPALMLSGAIAAACLNAPDIGNGLKESTRYTVGLLLFFTMLVYSEKEKTALAMTLLASGVAASGLAFYQYAWGFKNLSAYCAAHHIEDAFVKDYLSSRRVFFPFFSPNMLAGFLAMMIPLGLLRKKTRGLLIPTTLALLLTRSVGAFASIIAATMILFPLAKLSQAKKTLGWLLLGTALALILWLRYADPVDFRQPGFSLEKRSQYWSETLQLIKEHPFKGTGMGSFLTSQSLHAHNVFLEIWAECGFAGILSFVFFLSLLFSAGAKKIISGNAPPLIPLAFWGALVFMLHNLVDTTFFFLETSSAWWCFAGLLASLSLGANKRPGDDLS